MMRTPPTLDREDPGLGRIDYSQAPRAIYFVASTGDRWRVHDCVIADGKPVRVGLPATERATCRVFVASTGVKKVYLRRPREVWRLTAAQLDRQLTAAEFLATEAFAPQDRTAR